MPDPIDIHCPGCQQVIVPHDRMVPLSNYQQGQRNAGILSVARVTNTVVLLNADLICPNCGHVVYFRLSEQKLNLILASVRHA